MTRILPILGARYDMLTVISEGVFRDKYRKTAYKCRCECGSENVYRSTHLRSGKIKSCGCQRQENFYKGWAEYCKNCLHTDSKKLKGAYKSWSGLKSRCLNPSNKAFKDYGGRGITVCERWLASFQNFLDDMGIRPEGLTIGRIDNDGNYEPGNCRWETKKQQTNNTRMTIRIDGEALVLFCEKVGVDAMTVRHRIKAGWDLEKAMSQPLFNPKDDIRAGDRFGKLVVISDKRDFIIYRNILKTSGIKKHLAFLCRCDCGTEKLVVADKLRHGKRKSCGCITSPGKALFHTVTIPLHNV